MRRRPSPTIRIAALCVFLFAPPGCSLSFAQASISADDVARRLMDPCPDCQGRLLAGCECGAARTAKTEIDSLLQRGIPADEVVEIFRRRYGDWILATPPKQGFHLLGYLLPAGWILLGAGGLAIFLRRAIPRRARGERGSRTAAFGDPAGEGPGRSASPMTAADRARLRQALRRLED